MELKNLKETYTKSTDVNVWKHRSVWSDVKKNSIPALSVLSYLKPNGIERLLSISSVDGLFKTVDKEASLYATLLLSTIGVKFSTTLIGAASFA